MDWNEHQWTKTTRPQAMQRANGCRDETHRQRWLEADKRTVRVRSLARIRRAIGDNRPRHWDQAERETCVVLKGAAWSGAAS